MLRDEWEFEYTTEQLAEAARAQRDFRAGRVNVWEDKKEETIQRIKASGITVTDSIAAAMNNTAKYLSTQSGRGAHITIDATMQDDLNECADKIREHTNLRNQYGAWAQIFEASPNMRLRLQHDDWMYFFGK